MALVNVNIKKITLLNRVQNLLYSQLCLYHLRKKFDETIDDMIKQGICEEYTGPVEWLSNPVLITKDEDAL